jgi:hypothetical protein
MVHSVWIEPGRSVPNHWPLGLALEDVEPVEPPVQAKGMLGLGEWIEPPSFPDRSVSIDLQPPGPFARSTTVGGD